MNEEMNDRESVRHTSVVSWTRKRRIMSVVFMGSIVWIRISTLERLLISAHAAWKQNNGLIQKVIIFFIART